METKVVGYEEYGNLKLLPDVHDHLGEVQPPQTARSRTGPRAAPGNDFLTMLLKQKLLGMMNVVVLGCFGIP